MQNAIGNYQKQAYPSINIQVVPPKGMEGAALPSQVSVNGQTYLNASNYPANYYMTNLAQQPIFPKEALEALNKIAENTKKPEKQKTEITEGYVATLNNYFNSEKVEDRLLAAKAVVARLEEDSTRKNNPALVGCINRMLQDSSAKVRVLSLAALDANVASGDNTTAQILNGISQQSEIYGQDALSAKSILLKMTSSK